MASLFDRIGGAIGGVSIPKGQELTPEQRAQVTSAYMNAAQALLAASDQPRTSFGGALGQGLAGAAQGVQATQAAQFATRKARREEELANMAMEKQRNLSLARKGAPKFSDYETYSQWAIASYDHYSDYSLPEEANQFIGIFKPKTAAERDKVIYDRHDKWSEKTNKLIAAQEAYQTIKELLYTRKGSNAYAAMIRTIKALDGSVVREGEAKTFRDSVGFLESQQNRLKTAADGSITDEYASQILNVARGAISEAQRIYAVDSAREKALITQVDGANIADMVVTDFDMLDLPLYTDQMFKLEADRFMQSSDELNYGGFQDGD